MILAHQFSLDLVKWGLPPCIDVMQDDKYSRNLEISLYANGRPFAPEDACTVLVRYKKADGIGGVYDTLPDGTKAGQLSGNVVTVALAPQVCNVAGNVELVLTLISGTSELSSFSLQLSVHKIPRGMSSSREYVNITGFIPQPVSAEVGEFLMVGAVAHAGKVTAVRTKSISDITSIPEHVVICDLEGSAAEEGNVPVNADTLGGNMASSFVRYGDCAHWYLNVAEELGADAAEIRIGRSAGIVTVSFYANNIIIPSGGKLLLKNIAGYGGSPLFKVNSAVFLWDFTAKAEPETSAFLFLNDAGDLMLYTVNASLKYGLVRGNLTYMTADPISADSSEEVSG